MAVGQHGRDWVAVSRDVRSKTSDQCRNKVAKQVATGRMQEPGGKQVQDSWRKVELLRLSKAVSRHGRDWVAVSPLTSGDDIREQGTFSLPGSAALNMLGGLAFALSTGWPMAALLAASGSSLCYALSWLLMGGALRSVSGDSTWRAARTLHSVRSKTEQVKLEGRLTLLTYLISLRLFPGTPNWLLNMAMPHCGVPLSLFILSVLLGLAPYTFVTVSAGSVLATVESITDVLDGWLLLKLSVAALILAGVAPALRAAEARNKGARLSAAD
jgi:uncharacterized membrane protein YdjX (TVP38/TMEM64 family)